jgi:hypothetical protein
MSISDSAEQDYYDLIHKAAPSEEDEHVCATCGVGIKRVPGGKGTTYVHVDTGAVAGPGGVNG